MRRQALRFRHGPTDAILCQYRPGPWRVQAVSAARPDQRKCWSASAGVAPGLATAVICAYDWAGHNHFDGTEFGILAKLNQLRGGAPASGTIEEGYISAKMCLAAQESIETRAVVALKT